MSHCASELMNQDRVVIPNQKGDPPLPQTGHRPGDPPRPARPVRHRTDRPQGPAPPETDHPGTSRRGARNPACTTVRDRTKYPTTPRTGEPIRKLAHRRLTHNRSIMRHHGGERHRLQNRCFRHRIVISGAPGPSVGPRGRTLSPRTAPRRRGSTAPGHRARRPARAIALRGRRWPQARTGGCCTRPGASSPARRRPVR